MFRFVSIQGERRTGYVIGNLRGNSGVIGKIGTIRNVGRILRQVIFQPNVRNGGAADIIDSAGEVHTHAGRGRRHEGCGKLREPLREARWKRIQVFLSPVHFT